MQRLLEVLSWRELLSSAKKIGIGSYALIGFMFALFMLTAILAVFGWRSAAGTAVPVSGYVALVGGVLFSLVVGIGLMALVFYSSRSGYDEPARLIEPDNTDRDLPTNKLWRC
jgi:hypothetical protein